ncbi:MAG: NAD(P)/FAD-dependent oxidoreductase [Acidobacteriota bacterium]|nr:NAD(P)/FAD-dependent oxidoreductase [Acidobacteriota bacterium]
MREPQAFDVIVIGAGAAGLFCAIEARKRGRKVAVLEHAGQIGKKILISGGGRCNFTNLHTKPENFISSNRHFCKSALARYPPSAFISLIEKHRIPYHEKTLGQLFCDRSARDITEMLRQECEGVQIILNCTIREIRRTTAFVVETSRGEYSSQALVVATGGLSIPKMGATPLGYRLAQQFGISVRKCWPALVPLTFNTADLKAYGDLSGVSTEVIAAFNQQRFREKMLFTHRGLSGPAILQISSYWKPGQPIEIDLLPGLGNLPKRLARRFLEQEIDLNCWKVLPSGTEGYGKAEVTGGGIDTDELSSKTFESREVPGLFFIGEVVDITGHLGGFNFQWAWASGYSAGQYV